MHVLEAEEERGADGDAGCVRGRREAAEGELVAVDAGGEGVGGVDAEGGERGGAVGSFTVAVGCAERQRVLADQELDHGGVGVAQSSDMKGRATPLIGDGQQAPFPPVELGLRDHQLNEFQWRRRA